MYGSDRSLAMDSECLAWQARSAAHRLAFERCTDTWQDIPQLTLGRYTPQPSARLAGLRSADQRRLGRVAPLGVRWHL